MSKEKPKCICNNNFKIWTLRGVTHREDGPAVEHVNGDKTWMQNGVWHREDGPALEWSSTKTKQYAWAFRGNFCSKEQYLNKIAKIHGQEYANIIALIYA